MGRRDREGDLMPESMPRPPDHAERMRQARARSQWELGDESWADVILAAYLDPEEDAQALEMEAE
jgi:hypothetical protein